MTADDFVETLRSEYQTSLSRLGSSKSLYADTAGEMDPAAVTAAALADERAAAETFDAWATDTEGPLSEAFADAASLARDHAETLAGETEADVPDAPAIYAVLAEHSTAVERLGGVVGRSLVVEQKTTQRTGFFTGQADPQTAQTFRGFGEDVEAQLEQAVDLLAGQCAGEDDWAAAEAAASEVIEEAYDEYVETLEGMGVNPKDVC
ncbi:rubrerythrin family protein [Halapricum sp. CBA1109]|uniref:rubrerythrin family protein n=1 Tax=Halapricum sp. CBA1109 TaxID=2668068 RepID=UPI0012FCBE04|nr:rubrerythrin family protein [Halapricum sp. CBA1109]MUV89353.1 rubrerythrin family protein [Halapricum sp. CBA1109]